MKQTTLGAAISAALAAKDGTAVSPANVADANVRTAKTPKGKAAKLSDVEQLATDAEMYFSDETQGNALTSFYHLAVDLASDESNTRQKIWHAVAAIFPHNAKHKPTWHQVDVVMRTAGLVADSGDYLYQQTRIGLRMLKSLGAKYDKNGNLVELGELPAKSGGKKSGKREKSVSNFQRYAAQDLAKIRERMTEYKGVISPAALKTFSAALKMLDGAIKQAAA